MALKILLEEMARITEPYNPRSLLVLTEPVNGTLLSGAGEFWMPKERSIS